MQEQKSYSFLRWPTKEISNAISCIKYHSRKSTKIIEANYQEGQEYQEEFIIKSICNKSIFIALWHYLLLKQ